MPCHQPLLWLQIQGTAWDADSSQWATRVKKKKKKILRRMKCWYAHTYCYMLLAILTLFMCLICKFLDGLIVNFLFWLRDDYMDWDYSISNHCAEMRTRISFQFYVPHTYDVGLTFPCFLYNVNPISTNILHGSE